MFGNRQYQYQVLLLTLSFWQQLQLYSRILPISAVVASCTQACCADIFAHTISKANSKFSLYFSTEVLRGTALLLISNKLARYYVSGKGLLTFIYSAIPIEMRTLKFSG